jgi:hypothetical protein
MKRVYGSGLVIGLLTAVLASGFAYGHGFGGHGHGGGESDLVPPVVEMIAGHGAIHSVVAADKTNLHNLYSQVQTAHQQLVQDLAAGKDTTTDVQALHTAQNNLLAEKVKLAQSVFAGLTATQRTQVSQFLTQWTAMKQSQQQARMALFQQFGASRAASSDTPSATQ